MKAWMAGTSPAMTACDKKGHIHNAARPAVASAKAEKAEHFA
jgi:hypothetical protein